MQQLDRRRRTVERYGIDAERFAGGVDQQGADTLAAVEDGVAHRIVQSLGVFAGCGKRFVQSKVDSFRVVGKTVTEAGRQWRHSHLDMPQRGLLPHLR